MESKETPRPQKLSRLGNRKGSDNYDVKRRKTLKMLKAEHKKLRKMGPDRQDFNQSINDPDLDEKVRVVEERDEFAAEQAIEEGRDVVIPEEEYDYDRAIPRDVVYGEWNIDNLGADSDDGGFDDPEMNEEYQEYLALLEEIRLKKVAIELGKEHPKSGERGEVRGVR